jgi:hypothetical protein
VIVDPLWKTRSYGVVVLSNYPKTLAGYAAASEYSRRYHSNAHSRITSNTLYVQVAVQLYSSNDVVRRPIQYLRR